MTNQTIIQTIQSEEQQHMRGYIADRIGEMYDQPEGEVRMKFYAASLLIAGAELMTELFGPEDTAEQLKRLAEHRLATINPLN